MKRMLWMGAVLFLLAVTDLAAQSKLSIDKVYSAYLRTSGTIVEGGQIKGYFFLYVSDKIDKHTNEYTLQVLDQNLNKVKEIKFQDSKKLVLLEAAYNENSLAFLFRDDDSKSLDMKIYGVDGKLKYNYSRDIDKKTDSWLKAYEAMNNDNETTNHSVFDLGENGYVTVIPIRDGKFYTYEVNFYSSKENKQWSYNPDEGEDRYSVAQFLGSTDSLIILEVGKKHRALSGDVTTEIVGINFMTKRMDFEVNSDNEEKVFLPSSISAVKGKNEILMMGTYFDKGANIAKDFSKGLALYSMNNQGKILNKSYNSWATDFGKYLSINAKGKIDDIGFLCIHKMIQAPNGKMFVVGEGYKRQANAAGIALNLLTRSNGMGFTKLVVTDMVVMEFNDKYKLTNATIYDKTDNTVDASGLADFNSQHAVAALLNALGAFDYEFTTGEKDNSTFSICYSDWQRSKDYHGQTFNSIHYNGNKFNTDKIELKSKATMMRIFPAKAGSVMIMEYFKKDKRLDFRLEKLG